MNRVDLLAGALSALALARCGDVPPLHESRDASSDPSATAPDAEIETRVDQSSPIHEGLCWQLGVTSLTCCGDDGTRIEVPCPLYVDPLCPSGTTQGTVSFDRRTSSHTGHCPFEDAGKDTRDGSTTCSVGSVFCTNSCTTDVLVLSQCDGGVATCPSGSFPTTSCPPGTCFVLGAPLVCCFPDGHSVVATCATAISPPACPTGSTLRGPVGDGGVCGHDAN